MIEKLMVEKLVLAFIIAFLVAAAVGKFLVPWLRRIKAGQAIKENGPTWHMSKAGTPTMGGIIFISAVTVACVTVGFSSMMQGDYRHIFVLFLALAFGAVGFIDDYEKLKKKRVGKNEHSFGQFSGWRAAGLLKR